MRFSSQVRVVTLAMTAVVASAGFGATAAAEGPGEDLRDRLLTEVGAEDAARVLSLLSAVDPGTLTGQLDDLLAWQEAQGGGFYGLLPSPVPSELPPVADPTDRLEAALTLAERRREGRAALEGMGFPLRFTGRPAPSPAGVPPAGMRVELDASVLVAFVDAMADGRVTATEAERLAALPANREMLRHRHDLGYVPPPLPTEVSLARLMARAGSGRALDRLWCWLAPESFFGYADVVDQIDGYRHMAEELRTHGGRLERAVAFRLAPYLPEGFTYHERFALTVGALVRGWTTAEMSGLNVEQLKDDWPRLLRTMREEVYHRLQLRLVTVPGGGPAHSFEELVPRLDDPAMAKLFEAVLYTVLEGTANLAAGPAEGVDDPAMAEAGAGLLARLVTEVVQDGDVDRGDELISLGLKGNGPLYALGYRLASLVAASDGSRAVPALLHQGPLALALRAQAVAPERSKPLTRGVVEALTTLRRKVEAARSR